jgi:hypothetical protein
MGWAHVGQVNASGDSGRWQAGQDTSAGSGVVKLSLLEIAGPPCGQRIRAVLTDWQHFVCQEVRAGPFPPGPEPP